jgi:hypothetical protein
MMMAIRDISAPEPGALQLFGLINQGDTGKVVTLGDGRSGRRI